MWDGAINHLDMQALAPIHNTIEMDERIEQVVNKLQATTLYPKLYYNAYGDSMITGENTLKAISAFMLTLVSVQSKYDSMRLGKINYNHQEKNGYLLFQKNCSNCHTEPLFTNYTFEKTMDLNKTPTYSILEECS